MRAAIVVIVVVAALFLIGWLSLSWTGNRASVNLETESIQQDSATMVDGARDLLETADEEIDQPAEP